MNDFVAGLIRWLVRGVLLLAGLVLFVGLLVLSLVLAPGVFHFSGKADGAAAGL